MCYHWLSVIRTAATTCVTTNCQSGKIPCPAQNWPFLELVFGILAFGCILNDLLSCQIFRHQPSLQKMKEKSYLSCYPSGFPRPFLLPMLISPGISPDFQVEVVARSARLPCVSQRLATCSCNLRTWTADSVKKNDHLGHKKATKSLSWCVDNNNYGFLIRMTRVNGVYLN